MDSRQKAQLSRLFRLFDEDNSGSIDIKELPTLLRALDFAPSNEQCKQLLARYDKDKDQVLSLSELEALIVAERSQQAEETKDTPLCLLPVADPKKAAEELFALVDANGDGFVAREELEAFLTSSGEPMTKTEVQEMLDEYDEEGDGRLDKEQFIEAFGGRLEEQFATELPLYATTIPESVANPPKEEKEQLDKAKRAHKIDEAKAVKCTGCWSVDPTENGGLKKPNNPQVTFTVGNPDEPLFFELLRHPPGVKRTTDGLRIHFYDACFDVGEEPRRTLETAEPFFESGYPAGDRCRVTLPAGTLPAGRAYLVLLSSNFKVPPTEPVPWTFTVEGGNAKVSTIPFAGAHLSHTLPMRGLGAAGLRQAANPQFFVKIFKAPVQCQITMKFTKKSVGTFYVQQDVVESAEELASMKPQRKLHWGQKDLFAAAPYATNTQFRKVLTISKPGLYTVLCCKKLPEDEDEVELQCHILNQSGKSTITSENDDEQSSQNTPQLSGEIVDNDHRVRTDDDDPCTAILGEYTKVTRHMRKTRECPFLYSVEDGHTIVDRITEYCLKNGKRFVDSDFGPSVEGSINTPALEDCGKKPCSIPPRFFRAQAAFDSPHIVNSSRKRSALRQGNVGDCWLVAAMGALAANSDAFFSKLDGDLIYYPKATVNNLPYNPAGIYAVKVYILKNASGADEYGYTGGEWMTLILDDYFAHPLKSFSNPMLFVRNPRDPGELWAPLIEKAVAKSLLGYRMLKGGTEASALRMFLGGISAGIWAEKNTERENFDTIHEAHERGWVVTASARPAEDDDIITNKQNTAGIVLSHGYAVLNSVEVHTPSDENQETTILMVKLLNPWGKGESTAKWCDTDASSWESHPHVAKACGYTGTAVNDGAFWMEMKGFLLNFKHYVVCWPHASMDEPATKILVERREKCLKAIAKSQ